MDKKQKHTQILGRSELLDSLALARGDSEADLLIRDVSILDLVNGDTYISSIAIKGRTIAGVGPEYREIKARKIIEGKGLTAVPGFIDGHVHIESSMMSPFEFERMTLPLGTTAAICDPHEITNVMGGEGFEWFLRSAELLHQNLFVQVSSCVPALPGKETNGSNFTLDQMLRYKNHPHVLGLAEMMNFPGVIHGDPTVLDKVEAFADMNLDGHCPLLRGKELNAYLVAGIQNCHETVTAEEGREKLQKGMSLIIREGSVAKNLSTMAPLVGEFNSPQCFLCTDDRNPFEISHEGHLDYMVKQLITKHGMAPHIAYRLSSFSAAKHFGLKRLGLIAPGKQADIVLLKNVKTVAIGEVISRGKLVSELELAKHSNELLAKSNPPIRNTIIRGEIAASDLAYEFVEGKDYRVIGVVEGEIITKTLTHTYQKSGFPTGVVKMVNVERYGKGLKPAIGLVEGMGALKGAIAASVAHDSHNLMAAGSSDEEIALALNALRSSGGGLVVVQGNKILAKLDLPVAGLISLSPAETISKAIEQLKAACKTVGCIPSEPFIQMAFLALPVIPELKLTDCGLFDVKTFNFTTLEA
jgi:adenine deaminase